MELFVRFLRFNFVEIDLIAAHCLVDELFSVFSRVGGWVHTYICVEKKVILLKVVRIDDIYIDALNKHKKLFTQMGKL